MENWIQQVRYLPDGSAIEAVKVSSALTPNAMTVMLVPEVLAALRLNDVFYFTARRRKPSDPLPQRGAQVMPTRDGKFITTAATDNTLDNLQNLPRFT